MKAVIMAGGMGTRLKSISGELPKPMVPLLGRPMMEHTVLLLRAQGFTDICATVRYRAGDIMGYFGDGSRFGVNMQYRVEQEPLGTAGGVKNCRDFYGDDDFLVISGDAACDFDLRRLMEEHRKREAAATIALYRSADPLRYGLAVTDSEGRIHSFIEKPDWSRVVTDMINTGIYVLSPRAMDAVPDGRSFDFGHELFPLLLQRGERLVGMPMDGYWCDVGTPAAYYRCCADALEGRLRLDLPEQFRSDEAPAAADETEEGAYTEDCPCANRAGLMGALSELMLDMGADYSDGIRMRTERYALHIRPCADRSAVRIGVQSEDAEFAKELALSAKELAKALEL